MSTSIDEKVTTDIIETLRDGQKGFAHAADKLGDSKRPDLVTHFRDASAQRGQFAKELETMAAAYGDNIDEDGSALATAHRSYMTLIDALSGSNPDGVISAASTGEKHTMKEYDDALEAEISADLRAVFTRQRTEVAATAAAISALDEIYN